MYKGSERWGDRRQQRQEGNTAEQHTGYLATSGTTEAEDETVRLEKRRKGKTMCSWIPSLDLLFQMFTHVSVCHIEYYDNSDIQIFFKKLFLSVWKLKL